MKVEFLPSAQTEVEEAVEWYNAREDGLGEAFRAEVADAVGRITRFPETWVRISPRARRCQMNRFPYGVLYQVREAMILIVAVMHHRRKPGYWHDRLD
jgi:plasmid stabilization system protein ParE